MAMKYVNEKRGEKKSRSFFGCSPDVIRVPPPLGRINGLFQSFETKTIMSTVFDSEIEIVAVQQDRTVTDKSLIIFSGPIQTLRLRRKNEAPTIRDTTTGFSPISLPDVNAVWRAAFVSFCDRYCVAMCVFCSSPKCRQRKTTILSQQYIIYVVLMKTYRNSI